MARASLEINKRGTRVGVPFPLADPKPKTPVNTQRNSPANKARPWRNFEFATAIRSISDCSLSVGFSTLVELLDFKWLPPRAAAGRIDARSVFYDRQLLFVDIDKMTTVPRLYSVQPARDLFFLPFLE